MATSDDFRRLFEATYPSVVAYARRRTNSSTDADDVVAEIYTTAWKRADALLAADVPLAWLYGVGLNVLRNRRRGSDRHLRLVTEATSAAQTKPPIADPSEAVIVREALGSLPDDDAELIRLIAWEGLSHAEAAAVLGCSTNAVGIRLMRARQRLDDALSSSPSPTQRKASNP
ncbi:MAG: RNA polymerase sigma factor [Acidimicrobiales bacterium]